MFKEGSLYPVCVLVGGILNTRRGGVNMEILNPIILVILCLTVILILPDYLTTKQLLLICGAFAICGFIMFGLISLQLSIGVFLIAVYAIDAYK